MAGAFLFLSAVFLFRLSHFPRWLAVPDFAVRTMSAYWCFAKTRHPAVIGIFFFDWFQNILRMYSSRKKQGTLRQASLPRDTLVSFLKSACALFEISQMRRLQNPPSSSDSLPKHQTQTYHRKSSGTEPPGKYWTSWKRKTAESKEALRSKIVKCYLIKESRKSRAHRTRVCYSDSIVNENSSKESGRM